MKTNEDSKFLFWVKYLKFISIFFAGMGIMWAIIGSFDPLGIYDSVFAKSFFGKNELPEDVSKAVRFLLAPFGATAAGYFVLQYFIVKYAFAKKEIWAYNAIIAAFFIWIILDSAMCVYHGAYFNILIANVPTLIAMFPMFFLKRYFVKKL